MPNKTKNAKNGTNDTSLTVKVILPKPLLSELGRAMQHFNIKTEEDFISQATIKMIQSFSCEEIIENLQKTLEAVESELQKSINILKAARIKDPKKNIYPGENYHA